MVFYDLASELTQLRFCIQSQARVTRLRVEMEWYHGHVVEEHARWEIIVAAIFGKYNLSYSHLLRQYELIILKLSDNSCNKLFSKLIVKLH